MKFENYTTKEDIFEIKDQLEKTVAYWRQKDPKVFKNHIYQYEKAIHFIDFKIIPIIKSKVSVENASDKAKANDELFQAKRMKLLEIINAPIIKKQAPNPELEKVSTGITGFLNRLRSGSLRQQTTPIEEEVATTSTVTIETIPAANSEIGSSQVQIMGNANELDKVDIKGKAVATKEEETFEYQGLTINTLDLLSNIKSLEIMKAVAQVKGIKKVKTKTIIGHNCINLYDLCYLSGKYESRDNVKKSKLMIKHLASLDTISLKEANGFLKSPKPANDLIVNEKTSNGGTTYWVTQSSFEEKFIGADVIPGEFAKKWKAVLFAAGRLVKTGEKDIVNTLVDKANNDYNECQDAEIKQLAKDYKNEAMNLSWKK